MAMTLHDQNLARLNDDETFIRASTTEPQPGQMRWAVHHLPGTRPHYVLQQQWTWRVEERNGIGSVRGSVEAEWRDVPMHMVPYTPAD